MRTGPVSTDKVLLCSDSSSVGGLNGLPAEPELSKTSKLVSSGGTERKEPRILRIFGERLGLELVSEQLSKVITTAKLEGNSGSGLS